MRSRSTSLPLGAAGSKAAPSRVAYAVIALVVAALCAPAAAQMSAVRSASVEAFAVEHVQGEPPRPRLDGRDVVSPRLPVRKSLISLRSEFRARLLASASSL